MLPMQDPDTPLRPCCGVSRRGSVSVGSAPSVGREERGAHVSAPVADRRARAAPAPPATAVRLPGGVFHIGSTDPSFPADGEAPVRRVRVRAFRIGAYAVTNGEFEAFADATDYRTEAERFGWSFVFHAFVPGDHPPTRGAPEAPWWRQIFGADWRSPEGPGSTIDERRDHPVVHVSWNDAAAYAAWAGGRLPTEAEWEYAARGGLERKRYPWGDELTPDDIHRCNIWQGAFPHQDTGEDGYRGTAPVNAFEPNGFGVYNMSGNVWEWSADWFGTSWRAEGKGGLEDPRGPDAGPGRVIKGGSYLCHASYCNRYRVAARTHNTPDSTTGHMGFRVVYPS